LHAVEKAACMYLESEEAKIRLAELEAATVGLPKRARRGGETQYGASFFTQLRVNLWRARIVAGRKSREIKQMIVGLVTTALILGVTYFQTGQSQAGLYDKFISCAVGPVILALSALAFGPRIYGIRPLFVAEVDAMLYSPAAFWIIHEGCRLALCLVESLSYGTVFYFITGFRENIWSFALYILVLFLVRNCVVSTVVLFTAILSPAATSTVLQVLNPFFVYFNGVYHSYETFNPAVKWIATISYMRLGTVVLLHDQMQGQVFTCEAGDEEAGTCIETGEAFLSTKNLDNVDSEAHLAYLALEYLILQVAAFLLTIRGLRVR